MSNCIQGILGHIYNKIDIKVSKFWTFLVPFEENFGKWYKCHFRENDQKFPNMAIFTKQISNICANIYLFSLVFSFQKMCVNRKYQKSQKTEIKNKVFDTKIWEKHTSGKFTWPPMIGLNNKRCRLETDVHCTHSK